MKNLLFCLIAIVLFPFIGNSQETNHSNNEERIESAYMSVKSGDEVVKYKFSSIKDFEENTDRLLDQITNDGTTNKDKCEVTVEVSVTVTVGTVSTTVSASVTTSCANVAATVKRLRAQLIAAVTGA